MREKISKQPPPAPTASAVVGPTESHNITRTLPNAVSFTVKHLISVVSNFHGSMKMTYWGILILVVMIYHAPDGKENLM